VLFGGSFALLADLALQHARVLRQIGVAGLEQEGIETATMLDGTQGRGRNPQADRTTERVGDSVTLQRFGRNRVLVLMFEWLTRLPDWTALPVNSQRRDMMSTFKRSDRA
jgi:hypothetical protein